MADASEAQAGERVRVVPLALGFYAAGAAAAVGLAAATRGAAALLGERDPDARGLLLGAAIAGGVVVLSRVADARVPAVHRAGDVLAAILGPLSRAQVVMLAVVSGVVEEALFRGALQPLLGLAGTSALFGVVHVVPRRALALYPLFAAAAGLLLGWVRVETGSVVPPALAHVLVNAANLAWLARRVRPVAPPA